MLDTLGLAVEARVSAGGSEGFERRSRSNWHRVEWCSRWEGRAVYHGNGARSEAVRYLELQSLVLDSNPQFVVWRA
jgi:hypothetical protein